MGKLPTDKQAFLQEGRPGHAENLPGDLAAEECTA
jgi:hypothetical protein